MDGKSTEVRGKQKLWCNGTIVPVSFLPPLWWCSSLETAAFSVNSPLVSNGFIPASENSKHVYTDFLVNELVYLLCNLYHISSLKAFFRSWHDTFGQSGTVFFLRFDNAVHNDCVDWPGNTKGPSPVHVYRVRSNDIPPGILYLVVQIHAIVAKATSPHIICSIILCSRS